jgi:hypothetical protein
MIIPMFLPICVSCKGSTHFICPQPVLSELTGSTNICQVWQMFGRALILMVQADAHPSCLKQILASIVPKGAGAW